MSDQFPFFERNGTVTHLDVSMLVDVDFEMDNVCWVGDLFNEQFHRWVLQPWLRVPPPSFFRFSDLENGKSDRAEIFITDRLPEKMRHVFEKKFDKTVFIIFFRKFGFS